MFILRYFIFLNQQEELYSDKSQEFLWLTRLLGFLALIKVQFLKSMMPFRWEFWYIPSFCDSHLLVQEPEIPPLAFFFPFTIKHSEGHFFQFNAPTPSKVVPSQGY